MILFINLQVVCNANQTGANGSNPMMIKRALICFSFFCSLAFLYGCKISLQEKLPAYKFLNDEISSWVEMEYYNGVAVQIVQSGKTVFKKNYGIYSDTTAVNVASAGKWIVAATIAALVDKGLLNWTDPVKKYLLEFEDIKGDATLAQLLSHTAGYPDYQPEGKPRDDYQTLKESVANILVLPYDTIPGTKFLYGGLAMQTAGRMAEVATGKDWESLFQEFIGRPLCMTRSHFIPVSNESGFSPMLGGGFITCLKDYMNFLDMMLKMGRHKTRRILSVEAIRMIESDQIKSAKVVQPEYVYKSRGNKHKSIYGLGVWREELDNQGNATLVSSPGWAGSYPWIDRKNAVYGFILAKVNLGNIKEEFSSFYGSAVLPLIVRDAILQYIYLNSLKYRTGKKGY